MCQRVRCSKCGKPTFVGCGRHVEQVLGDVPVTDRCHCREQTASSDAPKVGSNDPSPGRRWRLW
jgi:hypothetical protein